jgi:ubiquinone/menaquinone biosynthesis C-methylase UbiE
MRDEAEYKGDSAAVGLGARRCRDTEGVTDVWSDRAQAYRESEAHRQGRDLDLIVEWSAGSRTALDVATGGGHVARRLREAGLQVVTTDAAPGMEPDVVCRSEELPFADASFDVVVCRVAAHHFDDVAQAVREIARVSAKLVLISDNLGGGDKLEQAEKLRDPSHVRNYTEGEWRRFLEEAGARVAVVETIRHPIELQGWLDRAGCTGADAERVRQLVADRTDGDRVVLDRIVIKAEKG